ncbi:VCBS repeat-containing protein [Nannocystis sp. SCPEA4]|uniref:FG-GAP repeat domain-containing protein n=1 Tax=Nannocystis sp. SCPEA4 TaxID=2996787 RepID=UPI002270DF80|nr:VCBS repeat-containing protein [Nannocystis sp. SCPEA4]MCY1058562.1 VCBS repeat-containing protein [Nannocystis sp. SCPEA4]
MRTPSLLAIVGLVAQLPACNLDIKQCIGDCPSVGGGPGGIGGELGSCEIVDNLFEPATCHDGVHQPGELCFVGTLGVDPPTPITSSIVLPLDDRFGVDMLITQADDSVTPQLFNVGNFFVSQAWPDPLATMPVLHASGDFDEDGAADVVATTQTVAEGRLIRALLLDGAGGLAEVRLVKNVESLIALDAADWNGDGHVDIVTVTPPAPGVDNLFVFLGDGTGEFTETIGPVLARAVPGHVLGALDADGRSDDFVFTEDGSGRIVRHAGGQQIVTTLGMPAELWFHEFVIAELDGDGLGDLVGVATNTEFESSEAVVFLQQDSGEFIDPVRYPVHCDARLLAVADLDGDGGLDIITTGTHDFSTFRRGDGAGGFAAVRSISFGGLEEGDDFFVADFKADGTADLAGTSAVEGGLFFSPSVN